MTWHIWEVTYLRRNVTIVSGTSYHLLGSQISWDSEIWFQLQVKSYISDWRFSKSQNLARYVSRHNAMAYDTCPHEWSCQLWKSCGRKPFVGGIRSGCSRYQNSSPFHASVAQAQPAKLVLSSNCFLVSLDVTIHHSRKYG
jgi:hypothetical protein